VERRRTFRLGDLRFSGNLWTVGHSETIHLIHIRHIAEWPSACTKRHVFHASINGKYR
jgi:hypothetical protein